MLQKAFCKNEKHCHRKKVNRLYLSLSFCATLLLNPPQSTVSRTSITMRHRSSGSTGGFKTEAEIARAAAAMPVPLRRKLSLPTYLKRPKKSNMKVLTLDESLHSTWESSNQDPKTVGWNEIHIREYARTVGDNPSCSSGPPLT